MTTPYGTTTFSTGNNGGLDVYVQITDPLGGTERAEYWPLGAPGMPDSDPMGAPSGMTPAPSNYYMEYRTTYYWSKKAMETSAGDYNAAYAYQFNHHDDYVTLNYNSEGNSLQSEKPPYESRIWYTYPGQGESDVEGTGPSPTGIGRLVQNASGATVTQLTQNSYNAQNNLTTTIDPVGGYTTYNYAANGIDVTQILQGSDTIAAYTYNSQHLPLTLTDASGQTTINTYTAAGQILAVTDPKGETTTYTYGGNTNSGVTNAVYLSTITGPVAGATNNFTYDNVGRVLSKTDSEGYRLTYGYDALDHLTNVTYPDETTKAITYNRLDPATIKDREGRITREWYDANRHMILSQDPLGRTTQYSYCKCGLLEGITDPNGNTTTMSYDPASRLIAKTYADGKGNTFTYDLSGRLSTANDALGQTKSLHYNVDDTLAETSYSGSATPSTYLYWDSVYSRPNIAIDGLGATIFLYYPAGTLGGGKVQTVENFYGSTTYSYDQLGRTINRQIGSYSQSLAYDPLGRITNVVNPLGNFTNVYVDATARIASVNSSVGVNSTYGYYGNTGAVGNEDQRLSDITNKVGSSVKSQFGYQYDVVGNITRWSQTQPGAFSDSRAWVNQYDAADQLTAAAISDTVSNTIVSNNHYVYDLAGNRLTTQVNSSLSSGSFNNLNQLNAITGGIGLLQVQGTVNKTALVTVNGQPATWLWGTNFAANISATNGTNSFRVVAQDENTNKVTNNYQINVGSLSTNRVFSYDANGNLLSDGIRTYAWDVENRLIQVTQGTNTYNFGYDYAGRRVSEKLNGTLIKYSVWDGQTLAQEENATTTVTKQFYDQGEVQGGTNYYYLRDHLESVRELVDGSGTVQNEYTYDPYGNVISSGTGVATFQYAGYYEHAVTGLNLTLYRAYDPVTGRWQSRDPLPDAEIIEGPNLYLYVLNKIVMLYDPQGLGISSLDSAQGAEALANLARIENGECPIIRTEANNLAEQLTKQEAEGGAGEPIMQGKIKDEAYPPNQFTKMQHVHKCPDGENIVVHYWKDFINNILSGFKFKN